MYQLDDGVGRCRQEAIDQMRAGNRFRLGATVALERGPDARETGQRAVVSQREPDHILFLGLGVGSGAHSAKLLNGTRQRFSGFNQPRQCGDDVLRHSRTMGRIFRRAMNRGPPVRGEDAVQISQLSPVTNIRPARRIVNQ